jgi:ankyrin
MRVFCLILLFVCEFSHSSFAQESTLKTTSTEPSDQVSQSKLEEELPKPIFDLIASGNTEEVKKLLRDSVDFYAHTKNGETALTLAIQNEDVDMVKLLVKDAVINLKNKSGETPLTLAIKKGNPEIISLICRRAKGSLKNDLGEAPLYLAVVREDLFLVEELIRKGADVNRLSNGVSPLSYAASLNNFKTVGYLLKEGAIANLPNENGDIPLYTAIDKGYDIVAGILINKSSNPMEDVNWRTKIDETLLNIAIVKSHPEIVKILLNAGAEYEALDYFENSALHIAAREGNNEIVDILTKFGVSVNSRNLKGETAMMLAAKANKESTVKMLFERGANPELKDYVGYCVSEEMDLNTMNVNPDNLPTKEEKDLNGQTVGTSIYIEKN